MNTIQDRIRGSLIGGAIGDALGYPMEFTENLEMHNLILHMADDLYRGKVTKM